MLETYLEMLNGPLPGCNRGKKRLIGISRGGGYPKTYPYVICVVCAPPINSDHQDSYCTCLVGDP